MPRKKIAESLTARIFLITAGILLFAGAITFGFIAWATPSTYTAVVNDDLTAQVDALVGELADTRRRTAGSCWTSLSSPPGPTPCWWGRTGNWWTPGPN